MYIARYSTDVGFGSWAKTFAGKTNFVFNNYLQVPVFLILPMPLPFRLLLVIFILLDISKALYQLIR